MTLTPSPLHPAQFDFIYLASQSPRRRELLDQIGVRYELLLPAPHEDAELLEAVLPHEAPANYVQRVTLAKLKAAVHRLHHKQLPIAPILCADTTVALGSQIYGKPQDQAHACQMLSELQGHVHQVLTAVAVTVPTSSGEIENQRCMLSTSDVSLAHMSFDMIKKYADTGEPLGKAGAYAIQGRMAAFIEHIQGSYSGIMGLPLYETALLLGQIGFQRNCSPKT